jgi:hypothetical protein
MIPRSREQTSNFVPHIDALAPKIKHTAAVSGHRQLCFWRSIPVSVVARLDRATQYPPD